MIFLILPVGAGELERVAPGCVGRGTVYSVPVRVGSAADGRWGGADFSVQSGGVKQEVCGHSHAVYPVSVGILLDTSKSMEPRSMGGKQFVAEGLRRFLEVRGTEDEFFLAYVNEDPYANEDPMKQFRFTNDVGMLRPVPRARAARKTALLDTIYMALRAMEKARHPMRGLLIFSDGYDNESVYPVADLAVAARAARVPIFLILPLDAMPISVPDERLHQTRAELISLTGASGGSAVVVRRREQMLEAAETYAVAMRSVHTLYAAWRGGKTDQVRVKVKGVRRQPVLFCPREAEAVGGQ